MSNNKVVLDLSLPLYIRKHSENENFFSQIGNFENEKPTSDFEMAMFPNKLKSVMNAEFSSHLFK